MWPTVGPRPRRTRRLRNRERKTRMNVQDTDHKITHVTGADFDAEVLQSELPVLVDFWAPWCAPCRVLAPILEEAASDLAGRARVVKMNTDEDPSWAIKLGIQGIPTLVLFKGGKPVDHIVGLAPKNALIDLVERNL
jgi:thioredoxin 1